MLNLLPNLHSTFGLFIVLLSLCISTSCFQTKPSLQYCSVLFSIMSKIFLPVLGIVENNGVEPLTYCLQGSRSSQLS